ncbi:MAG: PilX N-terminal domain-containing pilus assembly protein [Candidatus Binatia bacterium]
MKRPNKALANEKGMVLVISLLILSLLIGVGVGAMVSMQTDLRTSANLKTGTQAFYLAEAGIEWGKQQVKKDAANPPNPAGGTQKLSPGAFMVSFLSPIKKTNLVATVIIRSTGNVGGSSHTIQALVTKTYKLSDGAVGIRGSEAKARFIGDSFLVDGRDYDPVTGALVPGASAEVGISVPNKTLEERLKGALSGKQQDSVTGRGGAIPNVAQSDFLSSDEMSQLVNDLCSAPEAVVERVPPEGTLSVSGNTTWGTRTSPQLRCIHGLASGGDTVGIEGPSSGVGLLVVRDSDLVIRGDFHWEGLIIVSGTNVGFRVEGGGNKEIFGSVMINENGSDSGPGKEEVKLEGAIKIRYSSSSLRRAVETLESIYSSLPSTIMQNYWRTENP